MTHLICTWLSCSTYAFISEPQHVQPSDYLPCLAGQLKPLKEQWPGCHTPPSFHKWILTEVYRISQKRSRWNVSPSNKFSLTVNYVFGDGHEFSLLLTIFTYLINSLGSPLKLHAESSHSLEVAFLLEKIWPFWYVFLSLFNKTGTNFDIWVTGISSKKNKAMGFDGRWWFFYTAHGELAS